MEEHMLREYNYTRNCCIQQSRSSVQLLKTPILLRTTTKDSEITVSHAKYIHHLLVIIQSDFIINIYDPYNLALVSTIKNQGFDDHLEDFLCVEFGTDLFAVSILRTSKVYVFNTAGNHIYTHSYMDCIYRDLLAFGDRYLIGLSYFDVYFFDLKQPHMGSLFTITPKNSYTTAMTHINFGPTENTLLVDQQHHGASGEVYEYDLAKAQWTKELCAHGSSAKCWVHDDRIITSHLKYFRSSKNTFKMSSLKTKTQLPHNFPFDLDYNLIHLYGLTFARTTVYQTDDDEEVTCHTVEIFDEHGDLNRIIVRDYIDKIAFDKEVGQLIVCATNNVMLYQLCNVDRLKFKTKLRTKNFADVTFIFYK
jgi:hypothetical protein